MDKKSGIASQITIHRISRYSVRRYGENWLRGSQDLLFRLHDKQMAENVELEKHKSKFKFSIAVSTECNVTFKITEGKLKLIEKLSLNLYL